MRRALLTLVLLSGIALAQRYTVSTLASGHPPADGIAAVNAYVGIVSGVASDGQNVFLTTTTSCVFRVNPAGIITRLAGNWRAGFRGDGGPAIDAQLNQPNGIAVDSTGNLFITDTYHH